MKKVICVSLCLSLLTGCMATIGTPSGIRQHYLGRNASIALSKQRNEQEMSKDKGYFAVQMERIKQWGKSYSYVGGENAENGS